MIAGYYSGVLCSDPGRHSIVHSNVNVLFAFWEQIILFLTLKIGQLNKRIPDDVQSLFNLLLCYHQRRG